MASEFPTDDLQPPEICHPFMAAVQLFWEISRRKAVLKNHRPPSGRAAEHDAMQDVYRVVADSAARAAWTYMGDFVGEVAYEDAGGYHRVGLEEINEYILKRWEQAATALATGDESNADDAALLRVFTTPGDPDDEALLWRRVRYQLTIEMCKCEPHQVRIEPGPRGGRQPAGPT